jgi:hypothetical protein
MKKLIIALAIATSAAAIAPTLAGPQLYDRQTGKYLGNLSANRYDLNSTSNEYGPYGSKYRNTINNPYSQYGSEYSADSANNPYATNPPMIIDEGSLSVPGLGIGY